MKAVTFLEYVKKCKSNHEAKEAKRGIINQALFDIYQAERFYSQPFKPELITELFEGLKLTKEKYFIVISCNDFIIEMAVESHPINSNYIVYDHKGGNCINFIIPKTLNDFISDCQRAGIELTFKPEIKEKLK